MEREIMINFILSHHNITVLGPSLRLYLEGEAEVWGYWMKFIEKVIDPGD